MELDIAQAETDVTIIFADICDFDSVVQSDRKKIVSYLDEMFRSFDILCVHYGC